jgi:hypothetical protein
VKLNRPDLLNESLGSDALSALSQSIFAVELGREANPSSQSGAKPTASSLEESP